MDDDRLTAEQIAVQDLLYRNIEGGGLRKHLFIEIDKIYKQQCMELKQHNKALIPLAAWAKKHGHSMFCDMRSDGVMKNCRCTCGWVDAHQNHGLTTDQHLELAAYSDNHHTKGQS